MMSLRGFIVAAWEAGDRLYFSGRLEDGRSFACAQARGDGAIHVPEAEARRAEALVADLGLRAQLEWSDFSGAPLRRLLLPSTKVSTAERRLKAEGLSPTSPEWGRAEDYLQERSIRGGVLIEGEGRPGRRVDLVFAFPRLEACDSIPRLRWLALDLETDRDERVVAASLVSPACATGEGAGRGGLGASEGFFLGRETGLGNVLSFPDEASLLASFAQRLQEIDPDVVTGWNIVDFDFRVLAKRFAALGLEFSLGRSDEAARLIEREGRRNVASVPGRAVIDAMRLMRASGERFDDLRLETVAQAILGEGKSVTEVGDDKLAELDRLRAEDPAAFVSYCIRDSELVLRILDAQGLDRLTQARAGLTGLPLDLAWTSIPAFERVYSAGLRERHIAVPPREPRRVSGAAGGTVLDPLAGFYEAVLVFDFRSLYPSLMRTFNIDPLAFARAEAQAARAEARSSGAEDIVAPNGARFVREAGILPATVARYTAEREKALAAGDETGAYVYKILLNSFYGVLGAEGCLYARTELAGAVTSFGRKYLLFSRDFFEGRGFHTLYGDTDSVFVSSGLGAGASGADLAALGEGLATELNATIAASILAEYGFASHLKIRCDKLYRRFFIPRLRIDSEGRAERGRAIETRDEVVPGQARGRAKGYAGLRIDPDGSQAVEIKGMEAARSDWTPLARRFQIELLGLAFGLDRPGPAGEAEVAAFCRSLAEGLRGGRFDGELVYRKLLRRPPEDYASSSPQVVAARLLGWEGRRGSVSYLMTSAGPEPLGRRSGAAIDYEHYVQHQLLPIARAVTEGLSAAQGSCTEGEACSSWNPEVWLADRPQMELGF